MRLLPGAKMHSWKKNFLVEELELRLPGTHVDCVFTNGWTATIWIAYSGEGGSFCTTGVDLGGIADRVGIIQLVNDIAFEVFMGRRQTGGTTE